MRLPSAEAMLYRTNRPTLPPQLPPMTSSMGVPPTPPPGGQDSTSPEIAKLLEVRKSLEQNQAKMVSAYFFVYL